MNFPLSLLTTKFHNFTSTVVLIPGKIQTSENQTYSFLSVQTDSLVNAITFSQLGQIGVKSTKKYVVCLESEQLV